MKNCNIDHIMQLEAPRIGIEDLVLETSLKEGGSAMDVIAVQSEFLQVVQVLALMSISVTLLSALLWWLLPDRRQQCKLM